MSEFTDALADLVDRETPDSVVPFAVVRGRHTRRARWRAVLLSCAAVVALALGVAAVAAATGATPLTPATGERYLVDGPPAEWITVAGVTLKLRGETTFHDARLVLGAPTTLVVEAGANPPVPHDCRVWTTARVLGQDSEVVRVGAFEYVALDRDPQQLCTLEGYHASVFELELGVPLGDRLLYAAGGDLPQPVLDPGDTLAAGWLPPGYQSRGDFLPNGPYGQAPGVRSWVHAGPEHASIEILQGRPTTAPSLTSWDGTYQEQVLARPTVRGHDGKVYRSGSSTDHTCLKWLESEQLTVTVCSRGNPAPLSAVDLVRVAEALARPNDPPSPDSTAAAPPSPLSTANSPAPPPSPTAGVVAAPSREPQGQYGGDTVDHLAVTVTSQYRNAENTTVDLRVHVLEQGSRVLSYDVDFGDGTTLTASPATVCPGAGEKYTERYTFRHNYAVDADYTFQVRIRSGGCGTTDEVEVKTFEIHSGVRSGAPA